MRYLVAKLIVNLIVHSYKCADSKLTMDDVTYILDYVKDEFNNKTFNI